MGRIEVIQNLGAMTVKQLIRPLSALISTKSPSCGCRGVVDELHPFIHQTIEGMSQRI